MIFFVAASDFYVCVYAISQSPEVHHNERTLNCRELLSSNARAHAQHESSRRSEKSSSKRFVDRQPTSLSRQPKRKSRQSGKKTLRDLVPRATLQVYTINQESRYLLVQGVPEVGAAEELVQLFALYGTIEE